MVAIGGPQPFLQGLFGNQLDTQDLLTKLAAGQTPEVALAGLSEDDIAKVMKAHEELKAAFGDFTTYLNDHPELPAVAKDLFEGLSGEELQIAAAALMDEAQEKISKVTAEQIKGVKNKLAADNQEKIEKLKEKIQKDRDSEPGTWGKIFGWVSKVVTAVVAVAAMVVGAIAMATGAGLLVGAALFTLGLYMAAGVTVDTINEVRKELGKEPLSWSPTLGQVASLIAKGFGASDETANWIKMGVDILTDIVVGVAMSILLPGVGLAITAHRALKVANSCAKLVEAGDKIAKAQKVAAQVRNVQGTVDSTARIGKGISDISVASAQKDSADISAEVKELVAKLLKLNAQFEALGNTIKEIEDKRTTTLKRASEGVAQSGEVQAQITANTASMA